MVGPGKGEVTRRAPGTRTKLLSFMVVVALSILGTTPAAGTPEPAPEPAAASPTGEPSSTAPSAETTGPGTSGSAGETPSGDTSSGPGTEEQSPAPAAETEEPPGPPASPVATVLEASAPASGYIRTKGTLTATLREQEGEQPPVAGAEVKVQRLLDGTWRTVSKGLVTDDAGTVQHTYRVSAGDNTFQVVFAGTETHAASTSEPVVVRGVRIASVLTLGGKQKVVDERRVRIDIRWKAADGRPITRRVGLYRKVKGTSTWRLVARPRVVDGYRAVRVRPRVDTVWRAVGP
ncbi:MAG TPA: hypothetical protein VFZ64_12840, partial [Nocardioidaceae bacterium]